jgi:glycosyltransferase involved in cell wall biosynthesis
VVVVPNGVDTGVFAPAEASRRETIRRRLGWEGRFVLLHNSSLGWNKGVEMMLEGLSALIDETPGLTLVIKGNDALYDSGRVVESLSGQIGPEGCARLLPHVVYLGGSMRMEEVAGLYQGADAYVCPYLAEGFNMPALEAVACGTPVVCTAGGPTDEFTNGECALRIASRVQTHAATGGRVLVPNFESYVGQVRRVVKDAGFRARAREAGPALARGKWTWKHAADALLAAAGMV